MRTAPLVLAGDITGWIDSKAGWLGSTLPTLFLIGIFALGVWMLIVTRGMIRKLIVFGLGAAIVYMILTNVPTIARKFGTELNSAPAPKTAVVDGLR